MTDRTALLTEAAEIAADKRVREVYLGERHV